MGVPLSRPPADSRAFEFGRRDLAKARKLVAREADGARLSAERGGDLVTAAHELAANSVRHGGGGGTLRIWREPDALVVDVRDRGRIEEPFAGPTRPAPLQAAGRGLWIVNQLCDLVQIRSGAEGTDVRLRMSLS